MKPLPRALALLGGLFLLSAAGLVAWAWFEDRPLGSGEEAQFRIPPGEALSVTAQRLAEAGLVRNPVLFRLAVQWGAGDKSVPSGTFLVPRGLSARAAAAYFRDPQPVQIRVTVPEGWTATKIAHLLEEKGVVAARDFLDVVRHPERLGSEGQGLTTLEGRLFPDTYLFPIDLDAAAVARIFLNTFRNRTASWAASFSAEEWERRLVLASIVEREYRVAEEASLIASVFSNRLKQGIPLGSCATIEYILTEVQGRPHPKRIFIVHTQIPSPFNTYLNRGLPPAAISNPGLTALQAAFEPASTKYLYFVVADASRGTHTFSANWVQHEKAREVYLNNYVTKG